MSNCLDIITEPIQKGSTISGDISSDTEDLTALEFFLLFYVDRRKPVKISKSEMTLAESGAYNWALTSQVTKNMDAGQYIMELCLSNGGVTIKKEQVFVLEESESAKEL